MAWRNDPDTLRASRNSQPVEWEGHNQWLERVLNSPEHVLRIADIDGAPVGFVRADRQSEGWELSWTVAPGARARGIGRRMLAKFVQGIDGRVVATIRQDNEASAKIAAAAGLARVGTIDAGPFERWMREERKQ